MYEKTYPSKRFNITLDFLKKHIKTSETIFDLGVPNPFSKIMVDNGYAVINTKGEDIDNDQSALQTENYDVFTGFEIFEHLLNPYTVLQNVKADKILSSIPLRLWFSRPLLCSRACRDAPRPARGKASGPDHRDRKSVV